MSIFFAREEGVYLFFRTAERQACFFLSYNERQTFLRSRRCVCTSFLRLHICVPFLPTYVLKCTGICFSFIKRCTRFRLFYVSGEEVFPFFLMYEHGVFFVVVVVSFETMLTSLACSC